MSFRRLVAAVIAILVVAAMLLPELALAQPGAPSTAQIERSLQTVPKARLSPLLLSACEQPAERWAPVFRQERCGNEKRK
jgi:hypothetical protein